MYALFLVDQEVIHRFVEVVGVNLLQLLQEVNPNDFKETNLAMYD